VAAGSAAVLSPGTELCSEEDVKRLLPKVKVIEVAHAAA
jgi:fructose-1-phosphate kinase PfkB-like protein